LNRKGPHVKGIAASLIFAAAVSGATLAAAQPARPVIVGADPELDACPSTGRVGGRNARGDNFLSVHAAPAVGAREVGRLRFGQILWICDVSAGARWYGVVYSNPGVRGRNCGLGHVRRPRAYAGPCPSGWVSTRSVTVIGG
jgi:hypothetical protein